MEVQTRQNTSSLFIGNIASGRMELNRKTSSVIGYINMYYYNQFGKRLKNIAIDLLGEVRSAGIVIRVKVVLRIYRVSEFYKVLNQVFNTANETQVENFRQFGCVSYVIESKELNIKYYARIGTNVQDALTSDEFILVTKLDSAQYDPILATCAVNLPYFNYTLTYAELQIFLERLILTYFVSVRNLHVYINRISKSQDYFIDIDFIWRKNSKVGKNKLLYKVNLFYSKYLSLFSKLLLISFSSKRQFFSRKRSSFIQFSVLSCLDHQSCGFE